MISLLCLKKYKTIIPKDEITCCTVTFTLCNGLWGVYMSSDIHFFYKSGKWGFKKNSIYQYTNLWVTIYKITFFMLNTIFVLFKCTLHKIITYISVFKALLLCIQEKFGHFSSSWFQTCIYKYSFVVFLKLGEYWKKPFLWICEARSWLFYCKCLH